MVMATDDGLFVSSKQIKVWEDQIAALQRKVAAAKEILGIDYPRTVSAAGSAVGAATVHGVGANVSFMGEIVKFANGSEPVSRAEIKAHLASLGFSEQKITTQFNTVLYKTMKAGRTSFLPNGKIWKGKQ
jgi:hypothetical protein